MAKIGSSRAPDKGPFNKLTPAEERVIVDKGTEPPFVGEYTDHFEKGTYVCRRCNALLYTSSNKFHSGCGWPSFDDEIPGAVKRTTDADGMRTEITCVNCGGHLGHVFVGEKITPKDTRHCVNSLSIKFVPEGSAVQAPKSAEAVFGGGCFWCTEAVLGMLKGVQSVTPGYSGGDTENPSYDEVCEGDTGYAEVVKVVFDPAVVSYDTLLEVFFATHDPTTLNMQGNDVGTQYRSVIFYADDAQKASAQKAIRSFEEKHPSSKVVTELTKSAPFYPAEEYHKDYFKRNPNQGYCRMIIDPKVKKFMKSYDEILKK